MQLPEIFMKTHPEGTYIVWDQIAWMPQDT